MDAMGPKNSECQMGTVPDSFILGTAWLEERDRGKG